MKLNPKVVPLTKGSVRNLWPSGRWERVGVIALVLVCLLTVWSAYAGHIRPAHTFFGTISPGLAMAFPLLLYLCIIGFVVCIFLWRRGATVLLVTLLAVAPSAYSISPLHLTPYITSDRDRDNSFTLMTYNVMSFFDFEGPFKPGEPNRTVRYFLDKNPDIICLQETLRAAYVNTLNITRGQRNLRDLRYPYQLHWHDGGLAMLSKYPLKEVYIGDHPSMPWPHYKAARVYLKDDSITIINCHLQSLGLDRGDRNVYHRITDGDISLERLDSASTHILDKLTDAFMVRAVQAEWVRHVVDSIKGNVIVCGDFNDVPLSYAARTVKGTDMADAFERTSLGPRITFHDNRFYFRIDHLFYRGNFSAYRTVIDAQPSSDHYPMMTSFMFNRKTD